MIADKLRNAILQAALSGDLTKSHRRANTKVSLRSWQKATISDVIAGHRGGGTPSKTNPAYWAGSIPWASIKDLQGPLLTKTVDSISKEGLNNSSSNLIPAGSVIVGMRMGVGKVSINTVDVAINQDLRALFPSKRITPQYLQLAIKGMTFESSGATVKGIKLAQLLRSEIYVPPIDEQKKIIETVDTLTKMIDRLAELERERESI